MTSRDRQRIKMNSAKNQREIQRKDTHWFPTLKSSKQPWRTYNMSCHVRSRNRSLNRCETTNIKMKNRDYRQTFETSKDMNFAMNKGKTMADILDTPLNQSFNGRSAECWKMLQWFYLYQPVSVVTACNQKPDYLSQLETHNLRVTNTFKGRKSDYRNYQRLVRYARMSQYVMPREKFCPGQSIPLKILDYKVLRREHKRRKSGSESSDQEKEKPKIQNTKEQTAQFKKNLTSKSKIFIICGQYQSLRDALTERGWIENPNPKSHLFDLKWTAKVKDIDFRNLEQRQVTNHFEHNACLTTKYGLAKSLKSYIYSEGVNIHQFYPRCYDLSDLTDFENFLQNYKQTYCQSILKKFASQPANNKQKQHRVKVALLVLKRRLAPLPQVTDALTCRQYALCSPEEWQALTTNNISDSVHKLIKRIDNRKKTLLEQVTKLLQKLEAKDPQFRINGQSNMWIIKPAHLSRGRGIKCYVKLQDILDNTLNKDVQFVVQKYIENPLIVRNRKFDIRQWVLVRSFEPAKIWIYEECYLRFCAEEYSMGDIGNKYVHLTNNAIQKHSKQFNNSEIEGNMWTMDQFKQFLAQNYAEGEWERMRDQMEQIIIHSIESCQNQIYARKNTYQLFGYDFMFDEELRPWLIEVNSSPSMDYSTAVTKKLVKMALEDCIKIMVDGRKKNADSGLFRCIRK